MHLQFAGEALRKLGLQSSEPIVTRVDIGGPQQRLAGDVGQADIETDRRALPLHRAPSRKPDARPVDAVALNRGPSVKYRQSGKSRYSGEKTVRERARKLNGFRRLRLQRPDQERNGRWIDARCV